ncbi:MAG: hypothetical protein HRT74_13030 [Flavobacteriales bacterium]|nr:hypothetical protein [Flavobacteriales bacterium]
MDKSTLLFGCFFFFAIAMGSAQTSEMEVSSSRAAVQKIAEDSPLNEDAWIQLYFNTRTSLQQNSQGTLDVDDELELKALENEIRAVHPNAAALDVALYTGSNYQDEASLELAAVKAPMNTEVREQLVNLATINNSSRKDDLIFLKDQAQLTNAEIEYARNVLNSVSSSSILIMNSEEDAHPLFYCQDVLNHRKDVQVLFLGLLNNPKFASQVSESIGKPANYLNNKTDERRIELLVKSGQKDVFLGLTLSKRILKYQAKDSYITGLAMQCVDKNKVENLPQLQNNWSSMSFQFRGNGETINKNYILPMLELRRYQKSLGQNTSSFDQQIRVLAAQHGLTAIVEPFLQD